MTNGILVLAEHDNRALSPASLHALAAAHALAKAAGGAPIRMLVAGHGCRAVALAAASAEGVAEVLLADSQALKHGLAETVAPLLVEAAAGHSHVVAAHTTYGKNILPRAAALLDCQQVSDVSAIEGPGTFRRPIYAGSAVATVESGDAVKVLTVRPTAFEPAPATGGNAPVRELAAPGDSGLSVFVSGEIARSERPELTAARVVVSGGRGIGSAENFRLVEALADRLGGAVGASRAAVDAGFISNDHQVGQTGKVVAPDLYIAVGISGAVQHLAGMKDSKVIVAINKDGEAPIFQVADYGLVADLFEALPELTRLCGDVDNLKH